MSHPLADIFHQAARLNAEDPRRAGNTLAIETGKEVIATGDLHGHRQNLMKIIAFADLPARPDRRLVLQEIIHGDPDARTGADRSVDVLLRAARLKLAHPEQVIFLLGNHDVAQATGNEITKGGRGVCEAFAAGVRSSVEPGEAGEVLAAINEFLLSIPIAARSPGGVMMLHTLPTPRRMAQAGKDVPAGPYNPQSLARGGCVYEWTWGRDPTPEQIDELAGRLGVAYFVLAHKRIETPFEVVSPRAIIITAEHERGAVLRFSSDEPLDEQTVQEHLRPIAALGRGN